MEQAEHELKRAKRYGHALSLFMIDIDFFKKINDRYGHKIGDGVIMKLTTICQEALRSVDILGRLGGEEFAVLLPETARPEAVEIAERLRMSVETEKVSLDEGLPIRFTVSIGVASFVSGDENIDELLSSADQALYEAKNSGRNKVCVSVE